MSLYTRVRQIQRNKFITGENNIKFGNEVKRKLLMEMMRVINVIHRTQMSTNKFKFNSD